MKLWKKLPAKLRNHIISALQTFWFTFLTIFLVAVEQGDAVNKALIMGAIVTAFRAVSRELLHTLKLTK
jgi:hypothetical protein